MTAEQAQQIITASLKRLKERDQIIRDGSKTTWIGSNESELTQQLTRLGRDILDRMQVREGTSGDESDLQVAMKVVEHVLMSRAWDIGAHYAGGHLGWTSDCRGLIREAIGHHIKASSTRALENAVHALFSAPDIEEAELLSALGRAAFGIQLLLASPRQVLFHKHALPHTLYIDANVLMPAITTGHPLRPVYTSVIRRLAEAAKRAGLQLRIAVGYQFLNEIVSHRRAALEIVRVAHLEDVDNLRRHIQFHSAVNTNVFVGAYGTVVGQGGSAMKFADFLAGIAPFTDEQQLASYLETSGIDAVEMDFRREHNTKYVEVLNPLKQSYEELNVSRASVLVEHEAQQLAQLVVDAEDGESSLFVTADRRLRSALDKQPELRRVASMTVSHIGLLALADVVIGLEVDGRSLARLIWAAPGGDEERALFDYFVNLGLREYDEGMAGELPDVAQEAVQEAKQALETDRIKVFGEGANDIAQTAQFLDRFEDRFYERWREAIQRRRHSDQ